MKGINLSHLGLGVVVVAVAGAIAFQVWPRPHQDTARAATPATSPTHSSQSSQPSASVPLGTTDPYAAAKQRAQSIVQAYYWLDPSDTEATRRTRVTSQVNPALMTTPDFAVGKTSCWDQARLTHHLIVRATVHTDQISTQLVGGPDILYMIVPGTVQQQTAGNQPYAGSSSCPAVQSFMATFQWRKNGNGWQLTHFGNPVDAP